MFSLFFTPLENVVQAHGFNVMTYADDTQLYVSLGSSDDRPVVLSKFEACVKDILIWCTSNDLACNSDKTEIAQLCSCFHSIPLPGIDVGGYTISPTPAARDLGVLIDSHLMLSKHVNSVCKSAFFSISNIGRIRKYLDRDNCERLVHAFISSKLDSWNSILTGLPDKEISKLQRVQNAAARLIVGSAKNEHMSPILQQLHWLPVKFSLN